MCALPCAYSDSGSSIIFISMGFIAHSPPNYSAAESAYGIGIEPIVKSTFVSLPIASKVNGIMNMVFGKSLNVHYACEHVLNSTFSQRMVVP